MKCSLSFVSNLSLSLSLVLTLSWIFVTASSCAHQSVAPEAPVSQLAKPETPKPNEKIRYVYIETPATTSGMTLPPPLEGTPAPTKSFGALVLQIFWPLITLLGVGLLMIVGLLIEHRLLTHLLEKRAHLKGS